MSKSRNSDSILDYDNPSWAYLQADKNGELRAYKKIIELLTINSDNEERA